MHVTSNSALPPLVTLTPLFTSVLTPYLKSANVWSTPIPLKLYVFLFEHQRDVLVLVSAVSTYMQLLEIKISSSKQNQIEVKM